MTSEEFEKQHQQKEMIELELNKINTLSIDFKVLCNNSVAKAKEKVQLLKFFHTWVFYYFYCADHKFIKHVLKNKFTFVRTLFSKALDQLYSRDTFKKRVKFVYCPNNSDEHFEKEYVGKNKVWFLDDKTLLEMHPYIVPLVSKNNKLEVNWPQIERIKDSVEKKLMDIVFVCRKRKDILRSLNVDETFIRSNFKASVLGSSKSLGIWDDKFTGVRYVKLATFRQ